MKKFENLKFAVIFLALLCVGFSAERALAKGLLSSRSQKNTAETSAPAAAATETQAEKKGGFFGKMFPSEKKQSKESGDLGTAALSNDRSSQSVQTVPNGGVEKKTNPIVKFFRDFGKDKPSAVEEPALPSESATPNATLSGVSLTQSKSWVGTEEPINEKPPFEPSYGVDRSGSGAVYFGKNPVSGEIVSEELISEEVVSGIPDQVILEDENSSSSDSAAVEFDENSTREMNAMIEEMALSDVPPTSEPMLSQEALQPGQAGQPGQSGQTTQTPDRIILDDDAELDAFPIAGVRPDSSESAKIEASEGSVSVADSAENSAADSAVDSVAEGEFILEAPETEEFAESEENVVSVPEQSVTESAIEPKWEPELAPVEPLTEAERESLGIMDSQEVVPPMPENYALSGMSPDEPLKPVSTLVFSPEATGETKTTGKSVPKLEFMEKKEKPVLNVSPQRLAQQLSKKKEGEGKSGEEWTTPPLDASTDVTPRIGSNVAIEETGLGDRALDSRRTPESASRFDSASGDEVPAFSCPNGHFESSANSETRERESDSSSELSRTPRAELKVHTSTPKNILVGSEEQIIFHVENVSDVPSECSVIEIAIPPCFTVEKTEAGRGTTALLGSAASQDFRCVWNLGTLWGHEEETLVLRVVPTQSASADFQVSWSNRKLENTETVTAEQPDLEMRIFVENSVPEMADSPVQIQLKNTGNCLVKKVAVKLQADSESAPAFLREIPSLLPGEERLFTASVHSSAREPIRLNAVALIKNRVYAQAENVLKVNYVDLSIESDEPSSVFAGMKTSLPVRLVNRGNCAAKNVKLCVELPSNTLIDSVFPETRCETNGVGHAVLYLDEIAENETRSLVLKLLTRNEGEIVIPVNLQDDSKILTESELRFHASGVANVQMELESPRGVLAVSEDVFYEIRLKNTGNKRIQDAKLFVFFAEGIEPSLTEQSPDFMEKGIVCFTVPEFLPGTTQTFRVKAGVQTGGNYPIRCQLKSEESGLDLLQQATVIYR